MVDPLLRHTEHQLLGLIVDIAASGSRNFQGRLYEIIMRDQMPQSPDHAVENRATIEDWRQDEENEDVVLIDGLLRGEVKRGKKMFVIDLTNEDKPWDMERIRQWQARKEKQKTGDVRRVPPAPAAAGAGEVARHAARRSLDEHYPRDDQQNTAEADPLSTPTQARNQQGKTSSMATTTAKRKMTNQDPGHAAKRQRPAEPRSLPAEVPNAGDHGRSDILLHTYTLPCYVPEKREAYLKANGVQLHLDTQPYAFDGLTYLTGGAMFCVPPGNVRITTLFDVTYAKGLQSR